MSWPDATAGLLSFTLEGLAIEVKPSDSRAKRFVARHGERCWECDVLPAEVIKEELHGHIKSWLDGAAWTGRHRDIERNRKLL
jgi:hypothetical protein